MLGKKTSQINIRIAPEVKKKVKEKASAYNLDITGFIEKIANEPVIFVSKDIKVILEAVNNV